MNNSKEVMQSALHMIEKYLLGENSKKFKDEEPEGELKDEELKEGDEPKDEIDDILEEAHQDNEDEDEESRFDKFFKRK